MQQGNLYKGTGSFKDVVDFIVRKTAKGTTDGSLELDR
jgi:hypothetical protein